MIRNTAMIAFVLMNFAFITATARANGLQPNNQQPNVLFIAVDDLRTELGCYGLPYVQSPHLDTLARQGVLFRNHYVQVPTCGASRYALLTGRSPATTGVTRSNNAFYDPPTALIPVATPAAQSMPELFRRNGYHTVLIGKISHTPDGRVFAYNGTGDGRAELPHAWDEFSTPMGSWKRGWGIFFAYQGGRHREDGGGHRDLMEFTASRDDQLPDGLMANAAIEKLKELQGKGKPFFMGLGFFKPHLPFVAPRADWDAIDVDQIPTIEHPRKPNSKYWHKSGEFYGYNAPFKKTRPLAQADRQRARRAYLACVRYVDRQIGRVLKTLDELDLADNTIVVVWGDHGWHLGESALWGKHAPYERTLRSTLIIRAPRVSRVGATSAALVETIDLYPTLVDLCGLPLTKTQRPLDGRSLRPLLDGTATSVRPCAISYWGKAVSVRSDAYRLIARRGKRALTDVELYRVSNGDDPTDNIAATLPKIVEQLTRYIKIPD